ncbi:MAG TPA: hypothetical protein VFR95_04690, partial [Gemmatimonadaceae bacterium]|nr:hypothetical protein [Gemmatimonadaceae bacterium]
QEPAELPSLVRGAERTNGARRPEGWDGNAGERVVEALARRKQRAESRKQTAESSENLRGS